MSQLFLMPQFVITGENSLQGSIPSLVKFGNKALIVTDQSMVRFGYVNKLTNYLHENSIAYVVYDEVNFEPSDICINQGVNLYKTNNCDFLIGLGGGSPIDAMKAIGLMQNHNGDISDFMGNTYTGTTPAMIAIPTTAGTGSETTQFTIITDTKNNIKMLLKGSSLIPTMAILDATFTMTAPPTVTAATGIDALCHAIEAYTSKKSQPLSDIFALDAIAKIFKYLPLCYNEPTNRYAREQMALASFEAGCSFNNSSVTLIHGMSRPIGANFHIAHGLSNAVLLYACIDFAKDAIFDRLAHIARYANLSTQTDDQQATEDFMNELKKLLQVLDIPTLGSIIDDHQLFLQLLDKMTIDAIDSGSPGNTIKEVSKKDIENIYTSLL